MYVFFFHHEFIEHEISLIGIKKNDIFVNLFI